MIWSDPIARVAHAGFDLVHTFDAHVASREPGLERLADGGALGILIGNTRALWPVFREALRDPALAAEPHPLDRYTERAIDAAFAGARIAYAHRRYGDTFLPFQRLAVVTGLGALSPSQLVIHPVYGPWFALRAIVVVEGTPPRRLPIAQPCRCEAACTDAFARALATADPRDWVAVREACTVSAQRYSAEQIDYHYGRMC
ncbi:MAG: hypothetical protein WKG01_15710 [Kofleriaceae bacterium]